MIHFEIIQSPDHNVIADFKFHKNEVYLGHNGEDLSIKDPGLKSSHLLLEIPENDLLIHPQKEVDFFQVNGKRATSIRKILVGDIIAFGNTEIKILAFERTVTSTKKQILDKKLEQLLSSDSERLTVIEQITKLMKS